MKMTIFNVFPWSSCFMSFVSYVKDMRKYLFGSNGSRSSPSIFLSIFSI